MLICYINMALFCEKKNILQTAGRKKTDIHTRERHKKNHY